MERGEKMKKEMGSRGRKRRRRKQNGSKEKRCRKKGRRSQMMKIDGSVGVARVSY